MPGPTLRPVARTATPAPARVDGPPAGPIEIDVRTRLFTWITDRMGAIAISRMSADDLARARGRRLSHNVVTSRVFGPMPEDVSLTDLRIAGPAGPLTLRLYRPHGPLPAGRPPATRACPSSSTSTAGAARSATSTSPTGCARTSRPASAPSSSPWTTASLPSTPTRRRATTGTPPCAGRCATRRPSAAGPTGSR